MAASVAALRDGRQLAESVAELLVTYARHTAEAEDVLAAIDAVLAAGGCELPQLVLLGPHAPLLLPVPQVDPRWAELARAHLAAGHEASLVDLWEADPRSLFAPDEGVAALADALEPCGHDADATALVAFMRWALADAHRARTCGVRGASAYITIEEPRLRAAGLARAYLLCETDRQCSCAATGTMAVVRRCVCRGIGTGWQAWAR